VNNHASDHSQREQRNSKAGEVPEREPGAAPEGAAEADVRLLAPETILASQFLGERVSPTTFSGEARLALAILQDAIQIYCKPEASLRLRREAASWLGSSDRSWCFSFERICEALGLEPEYVRRGLGPPGKHLPTAPGSRGIVCRRARAA